MVSDDDRRWSEFLLAWALIGLNVRIDRIMRSSSELANSITVKPGTTRMTLREAVPIWLWVNKDGG